MGGVPFPSLWTKTNEAAKHVESPSHGRLDEGSIPSGSTPIPQVHDALMASRIREAPQNPTPMPPLMMGPWLRYTLLGSCSTSKRI